MKRKHRSTLSIPLICFAVISNIHGWPSLGKKKAKEKEPKATSRVVHFAGQQKEKNPLAFVALIREGADKLLDQIEAQEKPEMQILGKKEAVYTLIQDPAELIRFALQRWYPPQLPDPVVMNSSLKPEKMSAYLSETLDCVSMVFNCSVVRDQAPQNLKIDLSVLEQHIIDQALSQGKIVLKKDQWWSEQHPYLFAGGVGLVVYVVSVLWYWRAG